MALPLSCLCASYSGSPGSAFASRRSSITSSHSASSPSGSESDSDSEAEEYCQGVWHAIIGSYSTPPRVLSSFHASWAYGPGSHAHALKQRPPPSSSAAGFVASSYPSPSTANSNSLPPNSDEQRQRVPKPLARIASNTSMREVETTVRSALFIFLVFLLVRVRIGGRGGQEKETT
jgi:hypothetical protein